VEQFNSKINNILKGSFINIVSRNTVVKGKEELFKIIPINPQIKTGKGLDKGLFTV
jgi:hypothetical protein